MGFCLRTAQVSRPHRPGHCPSAMPPVPPVPPGSGTQSLRGFIKPPNPPIAPEIPGRRGGMMQGFPRPDALVGGSHLLPPKHLVHGPAEAGPAAGLPQHRFWGGLCLPLPPAACSVAAAHPPAQPRLCGVRAGHSRLREQPVCRAGGRADLVIGLGISDPSTKGTKEPVARVQAFTNGRQQQDGPDLQTLPPAGAPRQMGSVPAFSQHNFPTRP